MSEKLPPKNPETITLEGLMQALADLNEKQDISLAEIAEDISGMKKRITERREKEVASERDRVQKRMQEMEEEERMRRFAEGYELLKKYLVKVSIREDIKNLKGPIEKELKPSPFTRQDIIHLVKERRLGLIEEADHKTQIRSQLHYLSLKDGEQLEFDWDGEELSLVVQEGSDFVSATSPPQAPR